MDQIALQSASQMCTKHSHNKIEFVQVNDLSNSPSIPLFYCTTCINQDLTFKAINYLLVSQIKDEGETKIIQKWPPINDYSIIDKLIQFTDTSDSSPSILNKINHFFTSLKEEFIRKVDLCEKKMINRALELPLGKESILKQYQQISQISKLRSLILEGNKNNINVHEQHCKEFIAQVESQKEQNSEQLSSLLEQCNQKEQLINFDYPNLIKTSIFSFIDEIDFFNTQNSVNRNGFQNNQINESLHSSKIMKLIANKTNFCSVDFLSQISLLLQKINPLLSNISYENIHEPNRIPIDFAQLSEKRFDLMKEFAENQIKIEKSRDYSLSLKNTQQYMLLEDILDNNLNFLNENLREQLKFYLIDSYPLLKQVNFTNAILDREKFDCFRLLSDIEIEDLFALTNLKQRLVSENKFNQSETKFIKEKTENLLNQFEDFNEILLKYPIFDLMKKKKTIQPQVKLIKTNFQDGNSRIYINQDNQFSINESQYNGPHKNNFINCVSEKVLQKEKKYIFRFKIEHSRSDRFELMFGLMSNSKSDTELGYKEYLSCFLFNSKNQIQYQGTDFGISKQLKGDKLRLSIENEIEMRIWLGGEQLEILDYPKCQYKVGVRDASKTKLSTINDLKLFIGMYCEQIKITLTSVKEVEYFEN